MRSGYKLVRNAIEFKGPGRDFGLSTVHSLDLNR